jgi:hypothetical protein
VLSHDFATRSCTFYATIFTSYSIIVNSRTSLCAFIFFICPTTCNTVLFFGRVVVYDEFVGTSMSGMSPPPCSSSAGTFFSFYVLPLVFFCCDPSLVTLKRSLSYADGFGMVFFCLGFFIFALPPMSFVRSANFLVFSVGLLVFCNVPASTFCYSFCPFFYVIGTFYSSE